MNNGGALFIGGKCVSVSTVSTQDNTANLNDATVYAFLANQPNRSQLVHEDLEQIHENDLEKMDLKWQLALLSMRARRECKSPKNQESRPKNQDSSRKTVNVEDTSSKAMVATDGTGFDWSYMADDEAPTNMALMAFSDSEEVNSRTGLEFKGYGPKDILTKSGIVPFSTARQSSSKAAALVSAARPINTCAPKPLVNVTKPRQNALQKSHSLSRRPFYQQTTLKNRNLNNKVNTAKVNSVNTVKGNRVTSDVGKQGINVVKSSACWVWRPKIKGDLQEALKDQGYFDSACSRHMTGNISYLTNFKEHDGGYVAFRGRSKRWILKCFIIEIENLVDKKVKIIRCDNRIECKNRVMNEFCEEKGIKREYSVAKTPQQNGVAERRNRTLIEAARTMLVDSNEGIFVGYSTISKAFRVYNTRTRKVEENLHITFLENKPMIAGGGPEWLFDIDALSIAMNYAPVPAGTNSNDFADNSLFDSFSQDLDSHNKDKHGPSHESKCDTQERPNAESSTKTVNTAGLVNIATPTYVDYPSDHLMSDLEDTRIFDDAYNDRDEGAEADYNNLEIVISVNHIPSTRVHKDHPKEQIIGRASQVQTTECLDTGGSISWKKAIGTKWVFRNKRDQRGIVLRNKARLVAQGHTQEEGIDYDKVFASVARIEAIRLFLAYALFMDFTVYQMEVKSAFLYVTITEEVYVSQPPGFIDLEFPDRVYKVEKALDGLHQAHRAWYETLFTYLLENGFRRGTIDKTLFIKQIKNDILLVQVLNSEKMAYFLVKTNVFDIMKKFGFSSVKSASTLMETHKPLSKDGNGTNYNMVAYLEKSDDNTEFHQIVDFLSSCSINYALTQIHDIVDGKAIVILESSVRSDHLFDDEDGRLIGEIDKDETINLVSEQREVHETAEPLKDDDDATLTEILLNIIRSTTKDKGKGIIKGDSKTRAGKDIDWNDPEVLRYHALQYRVFSNAKVRKNMCTYLKNQGGYKQSYFKGMKYEDIRPIFKRKLDEQIEEEVEAKVNTNQEIEEMKLYVKIVPDEDIAIDAIPLATKPLVIVKYKIVKEGKISTYHIIRADGSIKRYTLMIKLLENIVREDLETLWKLIKDKHRNTRPEEDYERVL
nr:hypothetical protein [Tanacetum cinerariifolium]